MATYNVDIRKAAADSKIKLWQIAEALGIADHNLSRKLRKELTEPAKAEIMTIIDLLAKEENGR